MQPVAMVAPATDEALATLPTMPMTLRPPASAAWHLAAAPVILRRPASPVSRLSGVGTSCESGGIFLGSKSVVSSDLARAHLNLPFLSAVFTVFNNDVQLV